MSEIDVVHWWHKYRKFTVGIITWTQTSLSTNKLMS